MESATSPGIASPFILDKLELLLTRYSVSYLLEGSRIEYMLTDRADGEEISFSLVLTHNSFAHAIHVCKFYPGLYRHVKAKYLSAALFFLLIHHFGQTMRLSCGHSIFLQTTQEVFVNFYAKLQDFRFKIIRHGQGENIDATSDYSPVNLDVSRLARSCACATNHVINYQ